MRHVVSLVLAAGEAIRFGRDKLMEPLPDGSFLGLDAVRSLVATVPRVIVVVRPGSSSFSVAAREAGATVIECPDAKRGMSHSIACGVACAPDAEGWLIALADMPFIRRPTYQRVADAIDHGADLAAPSYRGMRGHPVGFSARFRDELLALRGDRGARTLIERHADQLQIIDVDDPGVLRDVDRPADVGAPTTS